MTDTMTCGPAAALNFGLGKLVVFLPAIVLTVGGCLGASYVATPLTKTVCEGDRVVIGSDGKALWMSPKGEIEINVVNRPLPKAACVVKLDKQEAAQFVDDRAFTWNVWKKEHNG